MNYLGRLNPMVEFPSFLKSLFPNRSITTPTQQSIVFLLFILFYALLIHLHYLERTQQQVELVQDRVEEAVEPERAVDQVVAQNLIQDCKLIDYF